MARDFTELEELRHLSPPRFIEEAAAHYGISPTALAAFIDDYDIQPKGGWGPDDSEPLSMSMTEIAKLVDLPVKVLGRLQDTGVIHRPIDCGDFEFLKTLRKIWGNAFLLRCQLANFSGPRRKDLILRPGLTSKWERWVYGRFFFNPLYYDHNGNMVNPKDRIRIEDVADYVQYRFGVPKCANTLDRILKIRRDSNNDKKRIRAKTITNKDVLKNRSIPDTFFELEIELFGDDVMYS